MLIKILCKILYFSGLNFVYQKFASRRLILLGYHSISNARNNKQLQGELYAHLSIPTQVFEKQIRFLIDKGYEFLRFSDLLDIKRKFRPLPKKSVIVYFDDGYKDNYLNAYPILKKLNITAVLFPTVGFIEKTSFPAWANRLDNIFLTWEEMKRMADVFEFGSHTITHRKLTALAPGDVEKEVILSRKILEERLGQKVYALSFPHSRTNKEVQEIAKKGGYEFALANGRGPNYENGYFLLKKIPLGPKDTMVDFKVKIGILYPLIDLFRKIKLFL